MPASAADVADDAMFVVGFVCGLEVVGFEVQPASVDVLVQVVHGFVFSSSEVLLALFAHDRGAGVRPAFLAAVGAVQWVFGGCGGWSYRPGFGYRCERPIQLVEVMGLACVAYRARLHVRQSRAGE